MHPHRNLCLSVPCYRPTIPRLVLFCLAALFFAAAEPPAVRAQAFSLSADAGSLPIRTTLHLTATAGTGAIGTVTFLDGGTPLATVPLSAAANAVYASATLGSGSHSFSASYSGDPLHPPATSQTLPVVVTTTLPPSFTVAPNRGTLFNSQSLAASVLGLPPDATGSVTFFDGGNPVGSAPIARLSSSAYLSLGDDTPAGATLASPALAFPALLAAEHNLTLTSNATAGQAMCDVFVRQLDLTPVDFTQAGAPLSTLMAGTNDTADLANEPVFRLCHQAALAWLAVPREFKVLAADPGAVALSGPWRISPELSMLYNNGSSGSAQFSITSTGAPLYVWYLLDQVQPGLFTVSVDGVPDPTLYDAQPPGGIDTPDGLGFALLRIPVAPGPHVVQFTLQNGALGILAVGSPPSAADGSLHPTVLVADLPNENRSGPRDSGAVSAQFSADIQADVALLAGDGLDLRFVPTHSFMPGLPDAMSDAVHPNALGQTELAAAFDILLPAVPTAGITMFQANSPTASFTLGNPGVRSLTALYSGDAVYAPAISEPVAVNVLDGSTQTQLTTPALTVAFQAVVPLTATVAPAGASGNLAFFSNGLQFATAQVIDGVGTGAVSLGNGTWSLTATFTPFDGRAPSTSAPVLLQVERRLPSFSFSAQRQGLPGAAAAVLTAYVAPRAVTGSVVFADSETGLLATVPVVDGAAILAIPSLAPGPHTYSAAYSGDAVYGPVSSAPATLATGPLATSLAATLLSNPNAPAGSSTSLHVDALAPAVPLVPFAAAPFASALNATTVFMGDSITQWWSLPVNDRGIAGQTTAQMLPRFAANVLGQGFERVVILGGTNDTILGLDQAETLANLAAMAAQAAAAGIRPILATIPPLFVPSNDLSQATFSLNAAIRTFAGRNGYALLDYYAALAQHPELFGDGIHPNAAGYAVMETVLARTLLVPPGSVTLPDGTSATLSATGTATLTTTALPAGPQQLTVSYPGASGFAPASASVQIDLTQLTSATTLQVQPLAGYAGNAAAITASVTILQNQGASGLFPTGVVNFLDNGRPVGSATLGSRQTATWTVSNLAPGIHAFTAAYAGDPSFTGSTATGADLTSPFSNTSLALSAAAPTAIAGTPVTLTANLAPASASGTITFLDGNTVLAQLPLAAGQAALTTSTLALGSHALTAIYSGDANDSIATSPVLSLTVNPGPTTLTLAPLPRTQPAGTATRLVASIVPAAAAGQVTFFDSYTAPNGSQATLQTLGQSTLAAGSAALLAPSLAVGSHVLSAAYTGNPVDLASTSAAVDLAVTPLTSNITLTTPTANVTYATPAAFQVTVLPNTATGMVSLHDGSGATLAQAPLANGSAAFTLPSLAVGLHSFTAAYAGDLDDAPANSAPVALTVSPAPITLTLLPLPAQLPAGSPITLTTSVSPATATGSVTFRDPQAGTLGQATLANGAASLTLPSLAAGRYSFSAAYAGDAQDAASVSNTVSAQVSLTPTTTTLAAPPAQVAYGQALTLAASTTPSPAAGSLTFFDGALPIGTAPLLNGTASLLVPAPALGIHTLHAAFSGDSLLAPSTSAPASMTVYSNTTATTLGLAQLSITDGDPILFNVQVAGSAASAPGGTVSIRAGNATIASGTLARGPGNTAFATITIASTQLGPGSFAATAFYPGDAADAPSDSSAVPLAFTVVRAATKLTLVPATAVLPVQTSLPVAASVAGPDPAQIPTGTVAFLLNGIPIVSVPVDAAGNASATLPGQLVGSYALGAAFTPTGIFAGSAAPGQTITYTPPLSLAFPQGTLGMNPNSQSSTSLLITPLSGFSGAIAAACTTSVAFLTCTVDAPSSVAGPTSAVVHLAVAKADVAGSHGKSTPIVFALLLLLPLASRRRRHGRKLVLMLLAFAALAGPLTGCGTNGDFGTIPFGPQLVTVTVTAAQTPTQATLNIEISS